MPKDEIKNMVHSSKDIVRQEFENVTTSLQNDVEALKKSATAKL